MWGLDLEGTRLLKRAVLVPQIWEGRPFAEKPYLERASWCPILALRFKMCFQRQSILCLRAALRTHPYYEGQVATEAEQAVREPMSLVFL